MLVPTCPTSEEWTLWERSTHKFIAKWQAPACGEKECSHYRVKKVRKCALNREWRSSDVFKVKRREVDRFCEVLQREETGLQYLYVLSSELLFA